MQNGHIVNRCSIDRSETEYTLEKFAFIIHPIDAKRDVVRHKKYRFAKFLPTIAIESILKHKKPFMASHITGIESAAGVQLEGWFIVCPLTPKQLTTLPIEFVYQRLIESAHVAQDLGAKIIGLGAFTSVVGDGGVTVDKNVDIAVTTGNSYTVATAIQASLDGAQKMGIEIGKARVAVVGATGSIGRTCAEILAETCQSLALIGRDRDKLELVHAEMPDAVRSKMDYTTDIRAGLKDADIVVTVTSAIDVVVQPEYLKIGAVVCDVARPRDVSIRVVKERNDVLVVEGGVVAVPGPNMDFHFNFGFPPKTAYACMSETMMLALEGRYESFSLGKSVTVDQVRQTNAMAEKHGFKLAGYRSFEKAVSQETIDQIRENAQRKQRQMLKMKTVTNE